MSDSFSSSKNNQIQVIAYPDYKSSDYSLGFSMTNGTDFSAVETISTNCYIISQGGEPKLGKTLLFNTIFNTLVKPNPSFFPFIPRTNPLNRTIAQIPQNSESEFYHILLDSHSDLINRKNYQLCSRTILLNLLVSEVYLLHVTYEPSKELIATWNFIIETVYQTFGDDAADNMPNLIVVVHAKKVEIEKKKYTDALINNYHMDSRVLQIFPSIQVISLCPSPIGYLEPDDHALIRETDYFKRVQKIIALMSSLLAGSPAVLLSEFVENLQRAMKFVNDIEIAKPTYHVSFVHEVKQHTFRYSQDVMVNYVSGSDEDNEYEEKLSYNKRKKLKKLISEENAAKQGKYKDHQPKEKIRSCADLCTVF